VRDVRFWDWGVGHFRRSTSTAVFLLEKMWRMYVDGWAFVVGLEVELLELEKNCLMSLPDKR
jgi:hypothetical protein